MRHIEGPQIQQHMDAYFIIENGNHHLRDLTEEIAHEYVYEAEVKESSHIDSIRYIAIGCIFVAIMASCILIPITFGLDAE